MAEMTVLELTQEFCRRQGLPSPSSVVTSQDDAILQIFGLLNEGIMDLVDRYHWQQLLQRVSFYHGGGAAYAAVDFSSTYTDFKALIPDTLWDTTNKMPVNGPISAAKWTEMIHLGVAASLYNFRLYGNALRIYPEPDTLTDVLFAMEYLSSFGAYDATSAANARQYADDASYSRLPSNIVLADLRWRWRQAKGLPYAEDQRTCEEAIMNAIGREPLPALSMSGPDPDQTVGPGLLVAAGSWPL